MNLLTGDCIMMSEEMFTRVYKFYVIPHVQQQGRGSCEMPQCNITIRETCRDEAEEEIHSHHVII